jgi:hypothetical protein
MNPTTGMFQTLVAASSIATQNLRFTNAMLRSVHLEMKPAAESPGPFTTLNVIIPTVNEGDAADIQAGPLQPTDTADVAVSIPFNHKDSVSFLIRDWDKVRTPLNLSNTFVKPKLEALLRKVNRRLAAFVTAAIFPNYAQVNGAGTSKFARVDLTTMWASLVNAGVPVEDEGAMTFVTSPTAYGNMMADTSFYQEFVVGLAAAVKAQQSGQIVQQLNSVVKYDQQLAPASGTPQPGLMFHRGAIAMVTAPLPAAGTDAVLEQIIYPVDGVNLPVQIQMQYSIKDQGWLINLACAHGEAVIRPEYGSYGVTA